MGHRLSKIVTRTGDAGTTGLGDGSRVAKDSPRIEAIGDSAAECVNQLRSRGLDPENFEFTRLLPPH